MHAGRVAGVDWAGGKWLAVVLEDGGYDCLLEDDFETIWEDRQLDRILVDVPIGLPEGEDVHLAEREELDSKARAVTGRPSSVFPVPSREAARKAYDDEDAGYDDIARQNEDDLGKGLSMQSYYIAAAIGEVDQLLVGSDAAKERVVEAHPEVCFCALEGDRLAYSKDNAAGVGERLAALGNEIHNPGESLEKITGKLAEKDDPESVDVDDVLDALVLCVTARRAEDGLRFLPAKGEPDQVYSDREYETDSEGVPIRMAYWPEGSLPRS